MMLIDKSTRSLARLLGKMMTFVFALFCVLAGLFDEVSAATVTGTVRDRVSFLPIAFIQVIMSDIMCPLYGIGLPCARGRALDTAETGLDGKYQVQNFSGSMVYFTLTDPDSTLPGGYKTRIVSPSISGTNARDLYMLPKNGAYMVKGKALSVVDSVPIKGIKAGLYGVAVSYNGGYNPIYTERLVATASSDQAGQVTFSVDTILSYAIINLSDIDSSANGGTFLAASSPRFNAFDDTSTIRIYMDKYSTSVRIAAAHNAQPISPAPVVKRGTVELSLPYRHLSGQSEAVVVDSRGTIVARPAVSAGGLLRWDVSAVSRGVYFVKVPSGRGTISVRVFLP
jgi:hypothetical protein